jgi:hypothetical protein
MHACNPSYLGSGGRKIVMAKVAGETLIQKQNNKIKGLRAQLKW